MFGTDEEYIADAELAKVFGFQGHGLAFNFVHGQDERLAAAQQQAGQVIVGAGQLSARVHHHHHGVGGIERHFVLVIDLGGDQLRVVGNDAAGVDQAKSAP